MECLLSEVHRFRAIAGLLKEEDLNLSDTPKFGGRKYLYVQLEEGSSEHAQTAFIFESNLPIIEAFVQAYLKDDTTEGEREMWLQNFDELVRPNIKVKGDVLVADTGQDVTYFFIKL